MKKLTRRTRLVAAVTTGRHRAAKTLFRNLEPVVKRRMVAQDALQSDFGRAADTNRDCMQWLIDTSPRKSPWSSARMVGEIMAVWFGSVHQLAMVRAQLSGQCIEYRLMLTS